MNNQGPFKTHGSSGTWCKIAGGKIRMKVDEGTPGAIAVDVKDRDGNKTGDVVYQLVFDSVEGMLRGLRINTRTFGGDTQEQLVLELYHEDTDTRVFLTLIVGSRYWRSLTARLPNVDLSQPLEVRPYKFLPEGEQYEKTGVTLWQGGQKVLPAFDRDNRNGMPDMEMVRFQGKDRADFSKQDEWIRTQIVERIDAEIRANQEATPATPATEPPAKVAPAVVGPKAPAGPLRGSAAGPHETGADEDDLPF